MFWARWNRLFIREVVMVLFPAMSVGIRKISCTNRELVMVSEEEATWDIRFSMELTVWEESTCSERMLSFITIP